MTRTGTLAKKVWVRVLGCRSNICEGEFLAGELEARGAVIVDALSENENEAGRISAAVIVTCSVTSEADRKCRQLVRRARRAVGDSGIVAVCGCWAQGISADAAMELGIDVLVGSSNKKLLPDVVERELLEGRSFVDLRSDVSGPREWEELLLRRAPLMHTRAFVKVQDGCDHFCSYCVIPFLRGRPVSRQLKNVLDEVERLVGAGCREVVLTGIHLGMYGRDIGLSLGRLIGKISDVKGLDRLRLGSLEPFSLDGDLLMAMADSEVFCPHLHLPMQSGDDRILRLMRRGYTSGEYQKICEDARGFLGERLHISSDILVGFPGEDDNAFRGTLSLMRKCGLGRVHVFPFSLRKGTAAERLANRVPPEVKARRSAEALVLGSALLESYAGEFIGHEVDVLTENSSDGRSGGHTPHFLEARWDGDCPVNGVRRVKVEAVRDGVLECVGS